MHTQTHPNTNTLKHTHPNKGVSKDPDTHTDILAHHIQNQRQQCQQSLQQQKTQSMENSLPNQKSGSRNQTHFVQCQQISKLSHSESDEKGNAHLYNTKDLRKILNQSQHSYTHQQQHQHQPGQEDKSSHIEKPRLWNLKQKANTQKQETIMHEHLFQKTDSYLQEEPYQSEIDKIDISVSVETSNVYDQSKTKSRQNKDRQGESDGKYDGNNNPLYQNNQSNSNHSQNNSQFSYRLKLETQLNANVNLNPNLKRQQNCYKDCLKCSKQFLTVMRVGYCFSIFRFLFIIFVYYNISFTLPRVIHQYGNADKQVSQYGGYDYNNAYLNNHTNKNGNLDNANHQDQTSPIQGNHLNKQNQDSSQTQSKAQTQNQQYMNSTNDNTQIQSDPTHGDNAGLSDREAGANKNSDKTKIPIESTGYQPWNMMIYFLSASIDIINIIGYVTAIRFLKAEMFILQQKARVQDKKIARENIKRLIKDKLRRKKDKQRRQKLKKQQDVMQEQQIQEEQEQVNIENQAQNNVQQQPIPQNQPPPLRLFLYRRNHILRAGRSQSIYMSVFSLIREYRYHNKDQSAAFKITKIMHVFATFLFFGRMALMEHHENFIKLVGADFTQLFRTFLRQIVLWIFLFTAFFGTFQIDYHVIENSFGPYLKKQKFHLSKITQLYHRFQQWRQNYGYMVLFAAIFGVICSSLQIFGIFNQLQRVQQNLPASRINILLMFKMLTIGLSIVMIMQNKQVVRNSKKYVMRLFMNQTDQVHSQGLVKEAAHTKNQTKDYQNLVQENDGDGNRHESIRGISNYYKDQFLRLYNYRNLSLMGIYYRHSIIPQTFNRFELHLTRYRSILPTLYRCVIFLYFLAFLRQSYLIYTFPHKLLSNLLCVSLFILGEVYKFRVIFKSKINLMDSFRYGDLSDFRTQKKNIMNSLNLNNGQQKVISQEIILNNLNGNKLQNRKQQQEFNNKQMENNEQTQCSVCLNEYQSQQNVTILSCGHLFHTSCLFDWVKQKKQCPFCRLNIQSYFQQGQF